MDSDSEHVLTGSLDSNAKLFLKNNGQCIHTLKGHNAAVTSVSLGQHLILTGSKDQYLIIWDREEGKCLRKLYHESPLTKVKMYEFGKINFIVTGTHSGYIRIWRINKDIRFKNNTCGNMLSTQFFP